MSMMVCPRLLCRSQSIPFLRLDLLAARSRCLGELFIELALALGEPFGNHDADLCQEIPLVAVRPGEAPVAEADLPSRRGAWRDFHPHRAGGSLDFGLTPQRRLRWRDRHGGVDVGALDAKPRIRLDLDLQQKVAGSAASNPGAALPGEADLLAAAHAGGNPHRQVAPLTAARIGERDLPGAALNRLFQRDLERRLGVAAGLGPEPWLSPEAPAAAPPAPGTTGPEEHLEEVA